MPAWFQVNTVERLTCVMLTFVAGVIVGYLRGLKDGKPLLRSKICRYLTDLDEEVHKRGEDEECYPHPACCL